MRNRIGKGALIATGVVLSVNLAAGGALAYWRDSGSGSGSAATSAGATQPVTISVGVASTGLYPGGTGDVAVSIVNPNADSVHIGRLTLDTSQGTDGFGVDDGHNGCTLTALNFTTQTNAGKGWTVIHAEPDTIHLSSAVSMTTDAADACQGATFTVYLVAAA
jgi:hypothetical protein